MAGLLAYVPLAQHSDHPSASSEPRGPGQRQHSVGAWPSHSATLVSAQ